MRLLVVLFFCLIVVQYASALKTKAGSEGIWKSIKKAASKVADKASDLKDKAALQWKEMNSKPPTFHVPTLEGDSMQISKEEDVLFAQLSQLVYQKDFVEGNVISLSHAGGCSDITILGSWEHGKVRGWAVAIPDLNAVAVVFRGTQLNAGKETALANIKADLSVTWANCNYNGKSCGRLSKGFQDVWLKHQATMTAALHNYIEVNEIPNIYITGHSLGAAVASIATIDIVSKYAQLPDSTVKRVHLQTYGSPKVGNHDFVMTMRHYMTPGKERVFLSGTRYVNSFFKKNKASTGRIDPIAALPPIGTGYWHIHEPTKIHCDCGLNLFKYHGIGTYITKIQLDIGSPISQCKDVPPNVLPK